MNDLSQASSSQSESSDPYNATDSSAYDKLLQQVENLKVENNSLKKELSSNTNQISRLETEASSLKEMVLKLGNSINHQLSLENQSATQLNLECAQFLKLSVGSSSSTAVNAFSSMTLSPFSDSNLDIRWKIARLQQQRCTILESLKKEEAAKETYMCLLNHLNDDLNTVENNQSLRHDDKTHHILQCNISEVQRKMEKDLGTNEMMQKRVEDWFQQIRLIDCNLEKLQAQLHSYDSSNTFGYTAGEAKVKSLQYPDISVSSLQERNIEFTILEKMKIISEYCNNISSNDVEKTDLCSTQTEEDLLNSIHYLMKSSHVASSRVIINNHGGLLSTAELLIIDCQKNVEDPPRKSLLLRQWASVILTQLTFRDFHNKALLINMKGFMDTIMGQLKSSSEDIQQSVSSILHNISSNADEEGQQCLQQYGVIQVLTSQVQHVKSEATLKSMLGTLWNLSSHSVQNQEDICSVQGSLAFLITLLSYNSPSKSSLVVESAGGILRNVSGVIAESDCYRQIIREQSGLETLLDHLKSSSLTVVSNACGTLCNLSSGNTSDKCRLLELGAVSKLKKLTLSKHNLIAQGSNGAICNLLSDHPEKLNTLYHPPHESKSESPSLQARKLKQLQVDMQGPATHSSVDSTSVLSSSLLKETKKSMISLSKNRVNDSQLIGQLPDPQPRKPHQAWSVPNCDIHQNHKPASNLQPVLSTDSNPYSYENRPIRTWGKVRCTPTNGPRDAANSQVVTKNPVKMLEMPTDLAKKLRDTNDKYDLEDDNAVNYSLKYTEADLSSSPAQNQSCKNKNFSSSNQIQSSSKCAPPILAKINKDENNRSKPVSKATYLAQSRPKIDPSVEKKLIYADKQMYDTEETPTNFGAIYTEERLDDECSEGFSLRQYNGVNKTASIPATDDIKNFNVEDTPICFSAKSSLSDIHAAVNSNCDGAKSIQSSASNQPTAPHTNKKDQAAEYPSDEEDDKFNLEPGAITPALYGRSNRHSGYMTPKNAYQDTPMMMYSSSESRSSLDSCDQASIHSDISSVPDSRLQSGYLSPSELPDSPGQSMPQSRCRSPKNLNKSNENQLGLQRKNLENASLSKLKGIELIEKAHAMSPSYLSSLPQQDDLRCFSSEPAMSVMTKLSELSMDGEKIRLFSNPLNDSCRFQKNADIQSKDDDNKLVTKSIANSVMQAGYVTSLPSSDEIKPFYLEGTLSPLTGLSEISCLLSHNDGFQKNGVITRSKTGKSITSNRNSSNTSRSSATGASVPLPPISKHDTNTKHIEPKAALNEKQANKCKTKENTALDDHLRDPSSAEMKLCGQLKTIKISDSSNDNKAVRNSSTVGEATPSDAAVEENSSCQKQAGYVTSVPSCDEIRHCPGGEGTMSPMTMLSDISDLKMFNEGFQKSDSLPLQSGTYSSDNINRGDNEKNAGGINNAIQEPTNVNESTVDDANEDDVNDDLEDMSDFLDSSSGDDDGLLKQVIESAIPKNRTSSRSKLPKSSTSSNRKEKSSNQKHSNNKVAKSVGRKVLASTSHSRTSRDRIAAADSRLKGMDLLEYIENNMESVASLEDPPTSRSNVNESSKDTSRVGRDVISTADTLVRSYSVRKQLRSIDNVHQESTRKCSREQVLSEGHVKGENLPVIGHHAKVQAFLQSRPKTFATEGTPAERSRCTSLSDITIESDHKSYDFAALRSRLGNPSGVSHSEFVSATQTSNKQEVAITDGGSTMTGHDGILTDAGKPEDAVPLSSPDRVTSATSLSQKPDVQQEQIDDEMDECASSLSSLRSDEESNLLKDCISSAMPVARRDLAPIPPKQLVQQNEDYLRQNPEIVNFLNSPNSDQWKIIEEQAHIASAATVGSQNPALPSTIQSEAPRRNDAHLDNMNGNDEDKSDSTTGSVVLGGDAKSLMQSRNPQKSKKNSDHRTSSDDRRLKGRRRADVSGCDHLQHINHIDSSKSSSSKCKERNSESSPSPCAKCHCSHSCKLPGSASMGQLDDSSIPRRRRKHTTSSSKPITAPCGHVHDMRRPTRSRSAHAGYYPGVRRIYPPVDKMNSVMLSGIASMAARGEMVHCEGGSLVPVNVPVAYPRPILFKQGTYIEEHPSPVLLQSGIPNIPRTYQQNPPSGKAGKKMQNVPKKKGGLKKRLKKLISPSEEKKSTTSMRGKKKSDDKNKPATSHKFVNLTKDNERRKVINSNTWSKKHRESVQQASTSRASGHSSSLSLSSSSASSGSDASTNAYHQQQQSRNIYPTVSSITSHHIPKSPAAKTRMMINIPTSHAHQGLARGDRPGASRIHSDLDRYRAASFGSSSASSPVISSKSKKSLMKKSTSHSSSLSASKSGKLVEKRFPKSVVQVLSVHKTSNQASNISDGEKPSQRVVQEVAPFNYTNPTATSREVDQRNNKQTIG